MRSAARFALALVTAPDLKTARRLARAALEARLAACANLIPQLESIYWWQGAIENAQEVLLIFKTGRSELRPLEKLIVQNHPYETPEFIVLPLQKGNERYLSWWASSMRSAPVRKRKR